MWSEAWRSSHCFWDLPGGDRRSVPDDSDSVRPAARPTRRTHAAVLHDSRPTSGQIAGKTWWLRQSGNATRCRGNSSVTACFNLCSVAIWYYSGWVCSVQLIMYFVLFVCLMCRCVGPNQFFVNKMSQKLLYGFVQNVQQTLFTFCPGND